MTPLEWKTAVLNRDGCAVHESTAECEGRLQAHHVITQQHLRKRGLVDAIWNPLIGMGACYKAHRRHHSRHEPIPLERVPREVLRYVHELGLDWYMLRYYA